MATRFQPPLEVSLASSAGPIAFHEIADAKAWIENEADVWGPYWADPWPAVGNPYWAPLNRLRKAIPAIRNAVATAESSAEENSSPNPVIAAMDPYKTGECLWSDSPLAKRAIAQLSAATTVFERRTAAAFLCAATNTNVAFSAFAQSGDPAIPWFLGMIEYRSLSTSTVDPRELINETIGATLGKWSLTVNEHTAQRLRETEAIQGLRALIDKEHEAQKTAFATQTSDNRKKLEQVETFYTEGLRTQAPTKYWTDKARSHSIIGYVSFATFSVAALGLAFTAYMLGLDLVRAIGETQAVANGPDFELVRLETALSRFLVFLVPTFFAVWLLRTVLRISLSNLALADDARHRVTLIQTFRSLLEHEDKMEAPDRILMLQALFRPSPGGGDDESAPPNWFDVLVSRIKPGK